MTGVQHSRGIGNVSSACAEPTCLEHGSPCRSVFMVGRTVVIRCRRAGVTAQLAKKGIGPVEIDVADLESGNPRARRCCRRVPISTLSSPRRARDCLRTSGTRPTSRLRRTTIAVDAVGTLLGQ